MRGYLASPATRATMPVLLTATTLALTFTQRTARADDHEPQLTRAPQLTGFVAADYPPDLLAQGIGGEVILLIDIDEQGAVERAEATSATHPAFGAAALLAVSNFVFSPAEVDNRPSPIRIEYRYGFTPDAKPTTPPGAGGEPAPPPPQPPINFTGVVLEAGVRRPIAGAVIELDGRHLPSPTTKATSKPGASRTASTP